MRKRIVGQAPAQNRADLPGRWLDLEQIATVEVTSEDPDSPIETIFSAGGGRGWRALNKGEQHIRIVFDQPMAVRRIRLRFEEAEVERTQEFTIRWSGAEGGTPREIVRQQWNFSPTGSTSQVEDYEVGLDGVSVLELAIKPDIRGGDARASLSEWRIG
jgi:hypothetical protein